jgi:hypothetical protein
LTKAEKVKIILQAVDEAYLIPSYFEEDIQTAVMKALVMIEKKEAEEVEV